MHTKRTGHVDFLDKTLEASKPIVLETPKPSSSESLEGAKSGDGESDLSELSLSLSLLSLLTSTRLGFEIRCVLKFVFLCTIINSCSENVDVFSFMEKSWTITIDYYYRTSALVMLIVIWQFIMLCTSSKFTCLHLLF